MYEKTWVQEQTPYLMRMREYLHRFPDLSGEEGPTFAAIRDELLAMGFAESAIRQGVGLLATLRGRGRVGPRVIFRTPVDALPIHENTGLPFSSRYRGKMHACGHDATTAVLLGLARLILSHAAEFEGDVCFLFQAAEETLDGARQAIESGLIELAPQDYVVSFHLSPRLKVGEVGYAEESLFCGSGVLSIEASASGGHVSQDQDGENPLQFLAGLVSNVESAARKIDAPGEPLKLSVCQLHVGVSANVVPQSGELEASVRYLRPDRLRQLLETISGYVEAQGRRSCVRTRVDWKPKVGPMTLQPEDVALLVSALGPRLGSHLKAVSPSLAAEDASVFLERARGCYWLIGCAPENGGTVHGLHTDRFDFPSSVMTHALDACMAFLTAFFEEARGLSCVAEVGLAAKS